MTIGGLTLFCSMLVDCSEEHKANQLQTSLEQHMAKQRQLEERKEKLESQLKVYTYVRHC